MAGENIKSILESMLFVCDEPLTVDQAARVLEKTPAQIRSALDELASDLERDQRGIQLRLIAGGYRLFTHPANTQFVEKLVLSWDSRRLTQASLETLAIIAYQQPVTKISINTVRGVNSDSVIASLAEKGLVREMGREKSPGAPVLYGTTDRFLEKFGLNSLSDLPDLEEFKSAPAPRTGEQITLENPISS